MLTIHFYAHACFRLSGDGIAVITDPYTPGPGGSGFEPIDEPADIVLMSSATDRFHSDPSHVTGDPLVVNALDLPPGGALVGGLQVRPFPTMESLSHNLGHDPDANAMYLFELGGLAVLHMGDVGNPLSAEQLDALAGKVDVLLALAGDGPTIALDDLDLAIAAIRPKVVIPMHYYSSRGVLNILPVDVFVGRYQPSHVTRVGGPEIMLDPDGLAPGPQIVVLEQSR